MPPQQQSSKLESFVVAVVAKQFCFPRHCEGHVSPQTAEGFFQFFDSFNSYRYINNLVLPLGKSSLAVAGPHNKQLKVNLEPQFHLWTIWGSQECSYRTCKHAYHLEVPPSWILLTETMLLLPQIPHIKPQNETRFIQRVKDSARRDGVVRLSAAAARCPSVCHSVK